MSALLTDLYMLTMLQGFVREGMEEPATYEFFVRDLPPERGFLLSAGLEQVLAYLETLRFSGEELEWLASTGRFEQQFVDYLGKLRFSGDVHAMPEGTVFFPNEPILRVTAPIPQAQFIESRVINLLHFQTLIASKAARCVLVAPNKLLVDFGLRRAHGAEAGMLAARASYLAGFDGTATVLAGQQYEIPIFGTMAHSFVQAHGTEVAAFEAFARAHPRNVILLIDTYDTELAAHKVVGLAQRLKEEGIAVKAVRIDSGDLAEHARRVREILDEGGLSQTDIFSSGNLDELVLRDLLRSGAPIDGFGIGTRLDTSADAPYLDCAYKLVEYAGQPRRKLSEGKATWPGRKQVYRSYGNQAQNMQSDIITVEGDVPDGEPLIQAVMKRGQRLQAAEPLARSRERAARQLAQLPGHLRALGTTPRFPVTISPVLEAMAGQADRELAP